MRNDLLGDSCQQVTRTDCSSGTCPATGSRGLLSRRLCPSMRQRLEGDNRGTQRCVIYSFLISLLLFLVTLYPKSSLCYKPYSDQIFRNQSQDPLGWLILSGGSGPEPNSQPSSSFLLSSQWSEYVIMLSPYVKCNTIPSLRLHSLHLKNFRQSRFCSPMLLIAADS